MAKNRCQNDLSNLTIFRYCFVLFSLTREGLRIQPIPQKVPKNVPFPQFPIFPYVFITQKNHRCKFPWVTVLAETSKDLQIILISIVLSFTNSLSRTSFYFSLKTSFVYSNLFSFAKTVTIHCYIQISKSVRSPSSVCKKARAATSNYNPITIVMRCRN